MDAFLEINFFLLYPRQNLAFENNSVCKNRFLSAFSCWDSRFCISEMDQKFKFGGTIDYGGSYLQFLFPHFKVFRLNAILHDAAGAVRVQIGKGSGYSHMIGQGPKSCSLGHVT